MANSLGLSKEHEQFYSFMRCPICKQFPIVPSYFGPDGKKLAHSTPYPKMDHLTVAECPKCEKRWSVFSDSETGSVRHQTKRITVQADDSASLSSNLQKAVKASDFKLIETERVEEFIGSEQRLIDNSKSAISLSRKFTLSKEWNQSYAIDYERATTVGGDIGLGLNIGFGFLKLGDAKLTFQRLIQEKYSIAEGIKLAYGEDIELQIPQYTKLRVFFRWKRIWQHGVVQFKDQQTQQEFEVPFRVAIGITFDQTQIDEK
jgi:hypothetical protein